ncbi:MAG: outer membrane beta-barrel protein [Rhodospirillales bacterium]|nr:outer membrane beta-barrel protein [Rhodospirillales bacterium]
MALGCVVATALAASALPASAYESGDFLVQLLVAGFAPDASGSIGNAGGTNFNSGNTTVNPALNLTYFFTENIAAQTVLAVPWARVDLQAGGKTQKLTDQWVLPLSLIGQYHFFSKEMVSPFVGAGLTYAKFWEDQSHIGSHVEVDDTWGGLINFGLNFKIPDSRWVAVLDVKKWWLRPTNTHIGGNNNDNLTVNPWFFGVGVGYNFSTPALF